MGWKVLLTQDMAPEGREYLESRGHQLFVGRGFETADIIKDMEEINPDAMIVRISVINRDVIAAGKNLKVIVRHGTGYDNVDVNACREFGIPLLYSPIANSTSVAETALMLMLELSRKAFVLHDILYSKGYRYNQREDYYRAKLTVPKTTLNGKVLGIIGCGNIGSRLAKRALAMEMRVLCYDPFKPAASFPEGVEVIRNLDDLLTESDYVSLHVPATKTTEKMISERELKLMKKTAFLINSARGSVIDEAAVYEAAKSGEIAGVGLDAMAVEPMPADFPLKTLDNCIILPHVGGNTHEATVRSSYCSAVGVQEAYEGLEPTWPVVDIDYETAPTYTDTREVTGRKATMFSDIDEIVEANRRRQGR